MSYLDKYKNMWNIDEDYKIEGDEYNVTLYKRRVSPETKKESWTPIGYFPNAKSALKRYCDDKLNVSCGSAESLMEEIDVLYDLVEEIGNSLGEIVKRNN